MICGLKIRKVRALYVAKDKYAMRAAILCKDPEFCLYLEARARRRSGLSTPPAGTYKAADALVILRHALAVNSRKEIAGNPFARLMLERIERDFNRFKRRQRGEF